MARLLSQGEALPQAAMGWNAVGLNVVPVFNPTMGYVNYVVPAVFVLILHQVLLMGTGILGATQNQRSGRGEQGYWQQVPVLALLLARTLVVGAVCAAGDLLLRLLLRLLRHSPHRRAGRLVAVHPAFPASHHLAWGSAGGLVYPSRSADPGGAHLLVAAGLPRGLHLAAGADPDAPQLAGPVGAEHAGHRGFLRLNQMGAEFSQVSRYWWQLWGLALLHGGLACLLLRWRQQSLPAASQVASDTAASQAR